MKTILIVDDSAFSRSILVQIVQALGHETLEAGSGSEAVTVFQEKKPDLVIMDLLMPDMDGLEAIRKIMDIDPEARTIVCSTDKQAARQEEARDAGVMGFVKKPVNGDRLRSVLSGILTE